jgi:hypothetical protein
VPLTVGLKEGDPEPLRVAEVLEELDGELLSVLLLVIWDTVAVTAIEGELLGLRLLLELKEPLLLLLPSPLLAEGVPVDARLPLLLPLPPPPEDTLTAEEADTEGLPLTLGLTKLLPDAVRVLWEEAELLALPPSRVTVAAPVALAVPSAPEAELVTDMV